MSPGSWTPSEDQPDRRSRNIAKIPCVEGKGRRMEEVRKRRRRQEEGR